jgi:hypothetical protein
LCAEPNSESAAEWAQTALLRLNRRESPGNAAYFAPSTRSAQQAAKPLGKQEKRGARYATRAPLDKLGVTGSSPVPPIRCCELCNVL